jgi:hypothetical protein
MRSSSEYDDPDRDRDRSHRGDGRDHRDDRDKGLSAWDNRGSFDEGDPYTTNLYVGNIHPEVSSVRVWTKAGAVVFFFKCARLQICKCLQLQNCL